MVSPPHLKRLIRRKQGGQPVNEAEHFRRQWRLYQTLTGIPSGKTGVELAEVFGVSSKTIQRDLATLRAVGIPVEEVVEQRGRKRWKVPLDTSRVPQFTFEEAAAIYLGRRFLDPLAGTLLWDASQRAYAKLKVTFQAHTLKYLETLASSIHQTAIGLSDYAERAQWIDLLMTAIEDRAIAGIQYQSLKSDTPQAYPVHPLGFIYHEGTLYLVAFAPHQGEIRHYKVDRVHGVELTTDHFTAPVGFDLSRHLSNSFGVFHTDEPLKTVHIRFAPDAARYIQEHRWHQSQKLSPEPDGSVLCELQLSGLTEVQSWVMSFGPRAEVLEPTELREAIRDSLRAALGAYSRA